MLYDGSGKTVVVAGGTSGINRGIAKGFAESGARIFVFSRSQDKVDDTVAELQKMGVEAGGCAADVRSFEDVEAAFAKCKELFGEIDVLISGAAGNFWSLAKNISSNGFRAVLEIDVLGTHHVMTAAYPHLKKPGGSIINISAGQSLRAQVGQVHANAAKAGVDQITRTLAMEWGADGLRVNSVIPGLIGGTLGLQRVYPTEEALRKRLKTVPLGRTGELQEVADLCMFLSSDRAAYITGAVIPVDGGSGIGAAGLAGMVQSSEDS